MYSGQITRMSINWTLYIFWSTTSAILAMWQNFQRSGDRAYVEMEEELECKIDSSL